MTFRFQGRRAILTFPEHLGKETVIQAFGDLLPTRAQHNLRILHEKGKSGYIHTHVILLVDRRVKLASQKKWERFRKCLGNFDLKTISTDTHFERCLSYHKSTVKNKSEETSTVIYDTIGDWTPEVPYHRRVIEFLQNAQNWASVLVDPEFSEYISGKLSWAHEVYTHARMRTNFQFPSGKAWDWQQSVIDFVRTPTDNRTIHWVYDPRGGNGKSDLTNYLLANEGAFLVDCGKAADIAYAYDNQPIVVFDLARDTEDYCPYRTMEAFKNGRFFSPKYKSCLKTFDPPHVIVFANYMPKIESLSLDRWNITRLDDFQLRNPIRLMPRKKPQKKRLKGCPDSIKTPPEKKRTPPPPHLPCSHGAVSTKELPWQQKEKMEAAEARGRYGREDCQESGEVSNFENGGAKVFT